MLQAFDLTGKVAAVTGANGGIGFGVAIGLAQAGAEIAILSRNQEKNAIALKAVQATGTNAISLPLDVTMRKTLKPCLDEVKSKLGPIDILVNNAGIASFGGVLMEEPQDWDMVLATNLSATFMLSKYAAEQMVEKGQGGKIINITSIYAYFGSGNSVSYPASKGAITQLTKSMALEFAKHNIQVNAVAPGFVLSELTNEVAKSPRGREIVTRVPAGRWGKPADIAGAVIYLASAASDYVTGVSIPVDGGYVIA